MTLYRLPIDALTDLLMNDPELQFQFPAKVTHELRDAQRRAILINRRDAVGRLAMFITLMRRELQLTPPNDREVPLPMSRSDIANYLGLSLSLSSRRRGTRAARDREVRKPPSRPRPRSCTSGQALSRGLAPSQRSFSV